MTEAILNLSTLNVDYSTIKNEASNHVLDKDALTYYDPTYVSENVNEDANQDVNKDFNEYVNEDVS